MGSSVYLILLFINLPPFPPISGPKNTDYIFQKSESNRHNPLTNVPDTIESFFLYAVR